MREYLSRLTQRSTPDPGPRTPPLPFDLPSFSSHSPPPVLHLVRGRSTSALGTFEAPAHGALKCFALRLIWYKYLHGYVIVL